MTEQEYNAIIAEQGLKISKAREAEVEARHKNKHCQRGVLRVPCTEVCRLHRQKSRDSILYHCFQQRRARGEDRNRLSLWF